MIKDLKSGYFVFGNKGNLYLNRGHISKSSEPRTLCGTPMLSSNWCGVKNYSSIGCEDCIEKYNYEISNQESNK